MSELSEALAPYQTALDALPVRKAKDAETKIIAALVARSNLAAVLTRSQPVTPDTVETLFKLDHALKAKATEIEAIVGRDTLVAWRDTFQPPGSAWWWSLDTLIPKLERTQHRLWLAAAAVVLAVSLSLSADIAHRFLSGVPDYLSYFSIIAQAGATAVAGGALFASDEQPFLERFLGRAGISRPLHYRWKLWIALALLLAVLGLRSALPLLARSYRQQGDWQLNTFRASSAVQSFQQALSLNPDYADAHYDLGNTYEILLDYDKAMLEYQAAIRSDPTAYPAYNNLARLYVLRRTDPSSALGLLDTGVDLAEKSNTSDDARYTLYKNRGWANFTLKFLTAAQNDLHKALSIKNYVSGHCLLAQVLEAQNKLNDARPEWEGCLGFNSLPDPFPLEPVWRGMANEHLSEQTK